MKKFLVAIIALGMTSAMANHHGNHHHKGHGHTHSDIKHMVTFGNFGDAGNSATFDLSFNDSDTDADKSSNVALNYTYAINNSFMAGLFYSNAKMQANKSSTIGLHGYYNLDGKAIDTCYIGLHYDMTNLSGDLDQTQISLEYGHRFNVGSWMGMHLAFSPSVSYAVTTTETTSGDVDSSALAWNFIKFDVLF